MHKTFFILSIHLYALFFNRYNCLLYIKLLLLKNELPYAWQLVTFIFQKILLFRLFYRDLEYIHLSHQLQVLNTSTASTTVLAPFTTSPDANIPSLVVSPKVLVTRSPRSLTSNPPVFATSILSAP